MVRRGTLGKLEAEINPSVLVAISDLTRYVAPRIDGIFVSTNPGCLLGSSNMYIALRANAWAENAPPWCCMQRRIKIALLAGRKNLQV